MTYHRAENMMDYVFRTSEVAAKQLRKRHVEVSSELYDDYAWTGQHLTRGINKFNPQLTPA
jgi:hypothetical protein